MVKPIDLTSSLSYYDDVTEELVQSDMDLLNKQVTTYVSIISISNLILPSLHLSCI